MSIIVYELFFTLVLGLFFTLVLGLFFSLVVGKQLAKEDLCKNFGVEEEEDFV